jgi:universal stress protein A
MKSAVGAGTRGVAAAKSGTSCRPRHTRGFKSILVPVDFSACSAEAVRCASVLAARFGGVITLLHVVEPGMSSPNSLPLPALENTSEPLLNRERQRLEDWRRHLLHDRTGDLTLVRLGHAASEITDTAGALGAELIVLGRHEPSGAKEFSPGGTAERVLRHSLCPVLFVPAES